MKRAVFIAGDENIYFPALVALESIREHNPEIFDFYICFNGDKISPYMKKTLKKRCINFIDSKDLSAYGIEKTFLSMNEGHWPVDVFYNYALPIHLGNMGYEYSYKVDYDILCTGKYILSEIEPNGVGFSGWANKVNLLKENVPEDFIDDIAKKGLISGCNVNYMNVGFIGFNNKIYTENNMQKKFTDSYLLLQKKCPQAKLLEQIAFSFLIESTAGGFMKIPEAYNHRVLSTRDSDDEFHFNTKNIHFITKFKPWRKLEKDKMKWFIFNGGSHMYLYRNIWLDYASKVDGFEYFCMERPLNTMQLAGMQMHVVRCFNEKIKSL